MLLFVYSGESLLIDELYCVAECFARYFSVDWCLYTLKLLKENSDNLNDILLYCFLKKKVELEIKFDMFYEYCFSFPSGM